MGGLSTRKPERDREIKESETEKEEEEEAAAAKREGLHHVTVTVSDGVRTRLGAQSAGGSVTQRQTSQGWSKRL